MPQWPPAMALRKRRTTPSAGSPPPSHHHDATLLVCSHPHPSSSSLKYVLFVTAAALLLLVFAISHRREAAASCRLCLLGEGAVREYRDGDGGAQHLLYANSQLEEDSNDEDDEDDEGEGDGEGEFPAERSLAVSHVYICPRLFHEKQTTPVDLMHALNNLMQGENPITREEIDFIAENHVSSDTSINNHRDYRENLDAEVIQAVAAPREKTVYFIDSVVRLDREIDLVDVRGDRLLGFLLHLKGRHWIAVRPFQGLWYNFDSTKAAPLLFCEGAQSVHTFLHKVVDDGGLIVALRKPRPASPITLAEKPPPPPPSWTDVEYWKYRLFG